MDASRSTSTRATSGSSVPALLVLGVLWGATFPIARIGIEAGANPFWLVTGDFALATAVSAVLALVGRAPRPSARTLAESAALGALMIGGINLPLYWGEQFATGGAASIVYATSPVLSLVFVLAIRHGPRPGPLRVLALAIGFAGVLVLSLVASAGGPVTDPWGIAAFALGATCQGAGAVMIGWRRPEGEARWGQTGAFAGAAAAGLVTIGLLRPSFALPASPGALGSLLYVGIVSMVIGYTIFYRMIQRWGAVSANLVTFVNPIVAVALGVLAFAEAFQLSELAGLALVLLALTLLELPRRPRPEAGTGPRAGRSGSAGSRWVPRPETDLP